MSALEWSAKYIGCEEWRRRRIPDICAKNKHRSAWSARRSLVGCGREGYVTSTSSAGHMLANDSPSEKGIAEEGSALVADWPIVGRAAEIQRALSTLEPGSEFQGVVLAGQIGVGKTVMARALAGTLESAGRTTRYVLGTQTGQPIPLGAFHRLVPLDEAHTPAVMLATAYRALAQDSNLVVVVDDAQWLDWLSAILIGQLAVDSQTRLIVTVRSDDPVPDVVRALWKERRLLRLDLKSFTRTQTDELAHAVLDGPVDSAAVDQLHDLASGNPLLLRALMTAALEDGALMRRDGRWRIVGPFQVGADLDDLAQRRLDSLGSDELDVIETIAAAEVLDWEILRELCSTGVVAHLERRGLVQFTADGTHTLARLAHPILGDAVLRRAGVARTRQLNDVLVQRISKHIRNEPGKPDVRRQIQLAQFMLNSDTEPDIPLIVHAATGAVTMLNLPLGERLARFACDRGGGLAAATVLGLAMSWQGLTAESEDLLMGFNPDGTDEWGTVGWGCVRAMNLFFGCGQVEAASEVLRTVRARVRPEVLDLVTAMEVSFAFFGGDLPMATGTGLSAVESRMTPRATVQTATVTACALALSGRHDEVPPIVERGRCAAEQRECGLQRFTIGFPSVLAVSATGDLAAADRMCAHYSAMAAGAPVAGAIVKAFIGRVEYLHGRLGAACEALQSSLSTLSESFPFVWLMLVAAWCAQAEAARGDAEAAARALARAQKAAGPQVAVFFPEIELARAWGCACTGETTGARAHALRAAAIARRSGMHAVEMDALHVAVRFGDRAQGGRLRYLKRMLATPLATAAAAHAQALAHYDGNRLDDAAAQFESIGLMAMAADAAAHAAREHAHSGARAAELESAARAQWLGGQCGLRSPATELIANPMPVTDREREVANLVAAGLTNRQIADHLCVSVRTVEGHLHRIFARLEIDGRDQLKRLVRISPAVAAGNSDNSVDDQSSNPN